MSNTQLVSQSAAAPVPLPTPNAEFAGYLHRLNVLKGDGVDWMRTYEIPGRKKLKSIVASAYAVYTDIEQSVNRDFLYERLRGRLRSEEVKFHRDAPPAALVIRAVFPTLDASRVSKYARALEAAKLGRTDPGGFVNFVDKAGGFEKIRLPPLLVLVPGKEATPATPDSYCEVEQKVEESEEDLTDAEMESLEFADELYELLEKAKVQPIAVTTLSSEASSKIDRTVPDRVILVAELVGDELRIFDQVPYEEQAVAAAYRSRFPTVDDVRAAVSMPSLPVAPTVPTLGDDAIDSDAA